MQSPPSLLLELIIFLQSYIYLPEESLENQTSFFLSLYLSPLHSHRLES